VSSCFQLLDVASAVDQELQQLAGIGRIARRAETFNALLTPSSSFESRATGVVRPINLRCHRQPRNQS
jgi:hypothetical protein